MIMNRFQHEKPTYILVSKMKYMFSSAWGSVLGKTTLKTEDTALPLPVGRDRKIRTAQRTNQIAWFVIVPSEKKIIYFIDSNKVDKTYFSL